MKAGALSYLPCEVEIIKLGKEDLILTSGTLDFDQDGENTGAPDDGWV